MILFDYEKIWLLSLGQSNLILLYFKKLCEGDPKYKHFLHGSNYMINTDIVTKNPHRLSKQKLSEYIGLCALRNYAQYKQFKDVDLGLEYFPPWVPRQVVDKNPLVKIKQNKLIYLKEI